MYLTCNLSLIKIQKKNFWKNYFCSNKKIRKNCFWFLRLLNPKAESLAIFLKAQKSSGMKMILQKKNYKKRKIIECQKVVSNLINLWCIYFSLFPFLMFFACVYTYIGTSHIQLYRLSLYLDTFLDYYKKRWRTWRVSSRKFKRMEHEFKSI